MALVNFYSYSVVQSVRASVHVLIVLVSGVRVSAAPREYFQVTYTCISHLLFDDINTISVQNPTCVCARARASVLLIVPAAPEGSGEEEQTDDRRHHLEIHLGRESNPGHQDNQHIY